MIVVVILELEAGWNISSSLSYDSSTGGGPPKSSGAGGDFLW